MSELTASVVVVRNVKLFLGNKASIQGLLASTLMYKLWSHIPCLLHSYVISWSHIRISCPRTHQFIKPHCPPFLSSSQTDPSPYLLLPTPPSPLSSLPFSRAQLRGRHLRGQVEQRLLPRHLRLMGQMQAWWCLRRSTMAQAVS